MGKILWGLNIEILEATGSNPIRMTVTQSQIQSAVLLVLLVMKLIFIPLRLPWTNKNRKTLSPMPTANVQMATSCMIRYCTYQSFLGQCKL